MKNKAYNLELIQTKLDYLLSKNSKLAQKEINKNYHWKTEIFNDILFCFFCPNSESKKILYFLITEQRYIGFELTKKKFEKKFFPLEKKEIE